MTYEIEYWVSDKDRKVVTTVPATSITDALQAIMEQVPHLKQKPSFIKRCIKLPYSNI